VPNRMLCTDCFHVAVPDTVLEGSDWAEAIAWCCFGVPGLLYCGWRHASRRKACPHCGSGELVREARAAAARHLPEAPSVHGPRILSLAPIRWPRALRTPRARLRVGGVVALLFCMPLLIRLLAAVDLAAPETAALMIQASLGLLVPWLGLQAFQAVRLGPDLAACRAWDERGRPLRIERV
jgi:hypothetical protein